MQTLEIPIFKKMIELYKTLHLFRVKIPKQDRFTIWQKCENIVLELCESLLAANQLHKSGKLPELEKMSNRLNLLRILLRIAKEVKTIDNQRYARLEKIVDKIGRMLGGWIKLTRASAEHDLQKYSPDTRESILN
jgi:hypothetical protein